MFVLDWAAAAAGGPMAAGGKGWNLGRLHRYHFPVPPGGVVHANAYRQMMAGPLVSAAAGIAAAIPVDELTTPHAEGCLEQVRLALMAAPLPDGLEQEVGALLAAKGLQGRAVAVRSSATAEDGPGASFAGIHESYLNLTGTQAVLHAVRRCYGSLWTPRAVAYRRRLGLPDSAVTAAAVILALVPARTAGVSFSCDLRTGRKDRAVISAAFGLGEAIVGGKTQPDEYLVDLSHYPPVIIDRQVGPKQQMTIGLDDGGTALVTADRTLAGRPALADPQIVALSVLTARVAAALGALDRPQDLEWAHDGQQFWLLQARPVTNLPPAAFAPVADQPVVWSNANLKDVMPDVQSALGWSFLHAGVDALVTAPLRAAGYHYAPGMTWVRLFEGRGYFNLSAMQWTYYDAMGITPAEFNRIIGGHQPELNVPPVAAGQRLTWTVRRLRMIWQMLRAMRRAEAEIGEFSQWAQREEQRDLRAMSNPELLAASLEQKAIFGRFLPEFNLINGASGGTVQELVRLLEPVFGNRAAGLMNAMLAGASGITSAEQGDRLVRLGNLALGEEQTRAWFTEPAWNPEDWAERLKGSRFLISFGKYLQEYGHRGVYELEPMNPRWREEPRYLLETLRSQVLSGREIHPVGRQQKRDAARAEVLGAVGWGWRRFALLYLLGVSARANGLRESYKSVLVRAVGVARLHALEIGRRMAAKGLLPAPDQVFHLAWLDLAAYLSEDPGLGGLGALAADRREQRERDLQAVPPHVIIDDEPVRRTSAPIPAGARLTGLGVAAGRAAGLARVIRHPHEGVRLAPGEVLVAPSTDPAWTPLFLRASAVVMEVGGYLSHGSIVAREYGLPAVANIPGLMDAIKDGEPLTVDGDTGHVYRNVST